MRLIIATTTSIFMAVSSAATYAESSRNLELERQVAAAMAGIAKADGLFLDEADVERRDVSPRVPFATDKSCGGVRYCTGLVLYYEKEPCSPTMAKPGHHTPGPGGNARDWYNIKDRGICYQASGASEKQGREIAAQLAGLDISRINAAWQAPSKIPEPYKQQATSQIPTISLQELHRLSKTGMSALQSYRVSTSINGYDGFGDTLCDYTRYDGYCDTNNISVQVKQDMLSQQQRMALYELRGKQGNRICATVRMDRYGSLQLMEVAASCM